jgi:hypothetical protein
MASRVPRAARSVGWRRGGAAQMTPCLPRHPPLLMNLIS